MANEDKKNLQHYIDIVQKVARVEHRRIPSHMVEYEELLSIGIIAIQVMIKNKTPELVTLFSPEVTGMYHSVQCYVKLGIELRTLGMVSKYSNN